MSRALLNPFPDCPALRVDCVTLSSVRPEKSPFEGPSHNFIVNSRCTLFLQDCVAVKPKDVVDTADAQTFSKEGELSADPGRAGRFRTVRE